MLALLLKVSSALKAGKELNNVAGWKNTQVTTNLVVVILALLVAAIRLNRPELLVSDDQLLTIATGVATILGGINSYLTVATTKKIGVIK